MYLQKIEERIAAISKDLENITATYHRFQGLLEEANHWKQVFLAPVVETILEDKAIIDVE